MNNWKPLTADEKRRIPQIILLYCMKECASTKEKRATMLSQFVQKEGALDNDLAEKAKALLT